MSRIGAELLLATSLCLVAACSGASTAAEPARKSVILISLDTLRADRMSLYGYDRPTTPELEEFAGTATLYERAIATAPWTLPSHASMLTGLYPFEHGARKFPKNEKFPNRNFGRAAPLDDRHVTLAEALLEAGYRTGGVTANVAFLDSKFGLSQGFESWDNRHATVRSINKRALKWLDRNGAEPFFLFLNYMDTHGPYNATPRPEFPSVGDDADVIKKLRTPLMNREHVDRDLLAILSNAYDTSIANLDEGLGELFDELRRRGLFDDCLIVITSDHGEFLGEHDLIAHGKDLYQEVIHVPLIVKEPGQTEGRVDRDWISHVHLPSLVVPHTPLAGSEFESLALRWPRDSVFSESYGVQPWYRKQTWAPRFDRLRRSIHHGDHKYFASSDGKAELYDIASDPDERNDLVRERPDLAARLELEIERRLLSRPQGESGGAVELSADHEAVMRNLGYAGDDEDEDGEDG